MRDVRWCGAWFAVLALAGPAWSAEAVIDTSFSSDGKNTVAYDLDTFKADETLGVFPAANGGYWLLGRASSASATNGLAVAVAKLKADGSVDGSFSGDGKLALDTVFLSIDRVAIDSSDRLYFAGTVVDSGNPGTDAAWLRVLPDGTPDTSIGFLGYVGKVIATDDEVIGMTVTPSSKVALLVRSRMASNQPYDISVDLFNVPATSGVRYDVRTNADAEAVTGDIDWSASRGHLVATFNRTLTGNSVCVVTLAELVVYDDPNLSGSLAAVSDYNLHGAASGCPGVIDVTAVHAPPTQGDNLMVAGFTDNPSIANGKRGFFFKITPSNVISPAGVIFVGPPGTYGDVRFVDIHHGSGSIVVAAGYGNIGQINMAAGMMAFSSGGSPLYGFGPSNTNYVTTTFGASGGGASSRNAPSGLLVEDRRLLVSASRLWAVPVDFDFAVAAWKAPAFVFADGFE